MVLEATMIDNSEWMRNGDYSPTRFQAQAEAVSLLCSAKTQCNPEYTVGVLAMAPTTDLGKILACMHGLEMSGELNLSAGIQVARLALKHEVRRNTTKKILESNGRKHKKNSVALDIVDFGEGDDEKADKLEALHAAVNNGNSHIVHVPPESNALCDVVLVAMHLNVDPNLNPELALALTASMDKGDLMDDDTALLQEALAMSPNESIPSGGISLEDTDMSEATKEDQELALVLGNHSYISSILSTLPGVDTNDDSLNELLKDGDKPPNDK
ncbi:hypothetical protein MKW94_022197 [Papaver nudicaule]|uniref:26S proteasome non-ATPase regulatory subunit 4 homolog n=1 Tax=Papaver nudicaule TaxID=74823 RepID=A0AA41UZE7_PAPNU|nr:hypothetical protein [Papaver nudicaule]